MATIISTASGFLVFADPASKTERIHGVVRQRYYISHANLYSVLMQHFIFIIFSLSCCPPCMHAVMMEGRVGCRVGW